MKGSEIIIKNFTIIIPGGEVVGTKTKFKVNGVIKPINTEMEILKLIRGIFLKKLRVKSFEDYNAPDEENPDGYDAIDWINSNFFLHYGKKQQNISNLFRKYPILIKWEKRKNERIYFWRL